jgi:hypothetical protein
MEVLDYTSKLLTIIVTTITAFVVVLVYLRGGRRLGKLKIDFNKDVIRSERNEESENLPLNNEDGDSDKKKFALLLQYHSQGLAQSKISFWFSLVFAAIGFAIIVLGILTIQNNTSIWNQGRAFLTLISGTIIDAVSALFFVQSNRARQLMTEFFDKLRTDRKFEESLKLANQIPDDLLKSKIKILLSINFADIKASDDIVNSLINGVTKEQTS